MNLRGVKATASIIDDVSDLIPKHITNFLGHRRGALLYYADPIKYSFAELEEMVDWCYATFGECGYRINTMETVWSYQAAPFHLFWFGEEKHLMLFILRWS